MAINAPARAQIYQADPFARFKDAYATFAGIKNEQDAKATLGKYAEGIYGRQAEQPQPQMTLRELATSTDPVNRLIGGSHQAAEAATDPTLDGYFTSIRAAESGGNDAAKNPNSSATGRYQFTDATWNGLAQQHPELGLTPDGRMDPAQQERAIRALTTENMGALRSAGIGINPGNLYAAHFLGAPTASTVLQQPDDTPMSAAVSPEVIQANPQLAQMSVGQFKAWASQKGGNGSGGYQAPTAPLEATAPTQQPGNGLPDRETMIALFRNPVTRGFAVELAKSAQSGTPGDKPTDDMREYAYAVAQGYQGTFADWQKSKSGGVTVNTGDNSGAFAKKADETAATRMSDYVSAGNDAANFIGDLKTLTELGKNVQTGKKTEILNFLGPYAEALGVKIEGLDDSQAYDAVVSRMAPAMRTPGAGASSDFDARQFLKSLPSLGNTPEGNQIIIETFQGIQDRKVAAAQIAQRALANEITWQDADKQIAQLGDPYEAFNAFAKRTKAGNAPPSSFEGTPEEWAAMTPEERALWQ